MADFDTKLETITGVGITLAAVILSEIGGDIRKFPSVPNAFKDPAVSLFYQKKRSEGKDHLTAIGHVCHKILAIIFAVLRDNKPYFPALTS